MDWFNIGLTIDTIGEVLLCITVLMVHHNVVKEHHIDVDVLRSMKKEQFFGILGIIFIIIGYVIQMLFR